MRHILQKQNYQLQQILQQAQRLQALNELMQQFLQPQMRAHCRVANYQQGSLVLAADNAAVATLLRYDLPNILQKIRQAEGFAGLANIKVHVNKSHTPAQQNPRRAREQQLSHYGTQCIQQLANSLQDSELCKALQRLGKQKNT